MTHDDDEPSHTSGFKESRVPECRVCDGTGYIKPACDACGRHGWIAQYAPMLCAQCDGEAGIVCDRCEGTGRDLDAA